jgi:hypothetical protein
LEFETEHFHINKTKNRYETSGSLNKGLAAALGGARQARLCAHAALRSTKIQVHQAQFLVNLQL